MSDSHVYEKVGGYTEAEGLRDLWRRTHANNEQTFVAVIEVHRERGACAVIAFDLDPTDFSAVASECVAFCPTADAAAERATRWMASNPRGVAPEDGGAGGSISGWVADKARALDDAVNGDQYAGDGDDDPAGGN
jgi:hypothetical protein